MTYGKKPDFTLPWLIVKGRLAFLELQQPPGLTLRCPKDGNRTKKRMQEFSSKASIY